MVGRGDGCLEKEQTKFLTAPSGGKHASSHAYRFWASHQHNRTRALHSSALAAGDAEDTPDLIAAFLVSTSRFVEAAIFA